MSYLSDQITSKLNEVFASALRDLPSAGRVSFHKTTALGRVQAAKESVKGLASANGFDSLLTRIDEVFASFEARYAYLPEEVVVSRTDVDFAVSTLVASLLALVEEPVTEDVEDEGEVSPVVEEIHGADDEDGDPYAYEDTDNEPYDGWDEFPADDSYVPDPIVIDISQILAPVDPEPVATIHADLWGVRATLTVQGKGAEIEFDGSTLLVSL